MAQSRIMTGARARMAVGGNTVGIFTDVSFGISYDANPAHILGRYSPVEITYTGAEPVSVTATGWRVIGHGPHDAEGAKVPHLSELLTHSDIELTIFDRVDDRTPILTVVGVRPIGYNTALAARAPQQVTINFLGLRASDESGANDEAPKATDLP